MAGVVHLIPTAIGRGAQRFARALVDGLGGQAQGHRLVTIFEGHDDVAVESSAGVRGGMEAAKGLRPRAAVELSRTLRRLRPDVVVAHSGDACKYAVVSTSAPVLYYATGILPPASERQGRLQMWRLIARRCRRIVAVSEDVARDYEQVLGLTPWSVVVAENGRDQASFAPGVGRQQGGAVRLLFVGYLHPGKRPDRFVELVRRLVTAGSPVEGEVVGGGPLADSLHRQAAGLPIRFLGPQADVVPSMQQADIFVFPSTPDGEGMPGVLIEAGLCGLPVVATAVPGTRTVIDHGRTGMVVPVDDADALHHTVAELVARPHVRRIMGEASRQRCVERFSMDSAVRRWRDILAEFPPVNGEPLRQLARD